MRTMQAPSLWCILFLFVLFTTITQSRDVARAIAPGSDNPTLRNATKGLAWQAVERYGKDLTFEQARDNGACHLGRLESGTVDQSIFNDRAMLNDNGWTAADGKNSAPDSLENLYAKLDILADANDHFLYDGKSLGNTFARADANCSVWKQDKKGKTQQAYGSIDAGEEYGPTKARFRNRLNPKAGILLCQYNLGPEYTIDMEGGDYPIPPLQRFSDVLWLQWRAATEAAAQSVGNIKYFLRNGVFDKDSLAVLGVVSESFPLKQWPGDTFEMHEGGDKENMARAILGTPNGNGIVWFLLAHTELTGKRLTVSKVQLWEGEWGAVTLLFYIEEVPS
ncbi:hypothetical protein LTR56_002384 [Elasticomyces elasticus]|nr:hypothetical protein LTR56_002384 [Elasticomyces elasticus]KAK3665948.1 hypothetical protein LTR22_003267 [Elasticomyces elasticus]KAK4929420.1 hypothetical protein LTR49_004024 [Elasticomyces elasticus]KAK5764709.1 hypothetical protein LTS12_005210 [Elasticomyces elasticus]